MQVRQRALWVIVFLSFGFTIISLQIIRIVLMDGGKYEQEAVRNHFVKRVLPATRGMILDAAGTVLAQTHFLYDIRLDGVYLKKTGQEGKLAGVAEALGMAEESLRGLYSPENQYILLREKVSRDVMEKLRALKVKALVFEEKRVRSYPNGALASHVIGFLGGGGSGVSGAERAFDRELRGVAGERWTEKDGKRREIAAYRLKDVPPVNGLNVSLTIDLTVQNIAEEEADRLMAKYRPQGVYIIAMKPKTGEILAMVNRPTFDANHLEKVEVSDLRNRCLSDLMEPGSTFKIVTMAGVLNEGIVSPSTRIFCENGEYFYAGKTLHDSEPHGWLTVDEILMKSSNIGFAKLGQELGEQRLYRYAAGFGFGKITGAMASQAESPGILRPVEKWSKLSITRIPMGHEVGATPMQMISAISAIANGGVMVAPRLIRGVTDSRGRMVQQFRPQVVRQIVSPAVARQVSKALAMVVSSEGTAAQASVSGFAVAGKTGTAQKLVKGAYSREKYLASFIGYLPEEDPEFSLLVMVDEPKGEIYGGKVAGPSFSSMAEQIAQYLNLVPNRGGSRIARQASL